MTETTRLNDRISTALTTLGISHEVHDGIIAVDRTSMVRASPRTPEAEAYGCVMDLIEWLCPDAAWVGWSVRTDDHLGISVYDDNHIAPTRGDG